MPSPLGAPYAGEQVNASLLNPSGNFAAVTKSDSTTYAGARALWVGTTGDVAVIPAIAGGSAVTFTAVQGGTLLPIMVSKVMSTNTTASNMVILF